MPEKLMPFSQIISRMRNQNTGVPYAPPTFAFVLGDTGYLVTIRPDMHPWATVFTGGNEFSFNISTAQWSETGRPPFARDIGNLIQAEVRRRTSEASFGDCERDLHGSDQTPRRGREPSTKQP